MTPAVQPYEQGPEGLSEIQRKPGGPQEGGGRAHKPAWIRASASKNGTPALSHPVGGQKRKEGDGKVNGVPLPTPNLKVSQSSG